jgi:hypothetical protein
MVDLQSSERSWHYLTGFRHDVFVSYAHVDNQPDRPDLEGKQWQLGWVDRFMQRFGPVLWKVLGARADLWFDRDDLYDGHRFDAEIEQVVQGSAVFLALITPAYLNAEYCRKELEWFVRGARASGRALEAGTLSRVLPVRLYDIDHTHWPSVLSGISGTVFHDTGANPQPFDPLHDDRPFTESVWRLARSVGGALQSMRGRDTARDTPEPAVPGAARRVFLAAASDAMTRQKRRLETALAEVDLLVSGASRPIPPPYDGAAHERAFTAALDHADLAVHLLDELPGPPIEGVDRAFPEEQCRLGLAHRCPQLVVLPEYLEITNVEEPSYRTFLTELEQGRLQKEKAAAGAISVVRAHGDAAILEMIREAARRSERPASRSAADSRVVFIDLQTRDLLNVADFYGFLDRRRLEAITMSSSEQTPSENTALFEGNLTRSRAFVIVFGAERDWVKSRLERGLKLILRHHLRFKPLIYAVPPKKTEDQLAFPFCDVLDGTHGFREDQAEALLSLRTPA